MRRLTIRLAGLVLVLASVVGCASSTTNGAGGGPSTSLPPEHHSPPADQIVFQVVSGGGFVPYDYVLNARPALTIYGDGTAFTIKDGSSGLSAITLRKGDLSVDVLDQLIAAAGESGLFDNIDFGTPGITDVGTTSVSFRPDAAPEQTASAYALGFDEASSGLTNGQLVARKKLSALITRLYDAVTYDGEATWTPDRIDVTEVGAQVGDETTTHEWPGPDPASFMKPSGDDRRCGTLTGADASTVYAAARANDSTLWRVDGKPRHLVVRALLPGETACSH